MRTTASRDREGLLKNVFRGDGRIVAVQFAENLQLRGIAGLLRRLGLHRVGALLIDTLLADQGAGIVLVALQIVGIDQPRQRMITARHLDVAGIVLKVPALQELQAVFAGVLMEPAEHLAVGDVRGLTDLMARSSGWAREAALPGLIASE